MEFWPPATLCGGALVGIWLEAKRTPPIALDDEEHDGRVWAMRAARLLTGRTNMMDGFGWYSDRNKSKKRIVKQKEVNFLFTFIYLSDIRLQSIKEWIYNEMSIYVIAFVYIESDYKQAFCGQFRNNARIRYSEASWLAGSI